jgi:hypothetical protein
MYIKISNESSGVNRLHLEKLGLSTKRNDPTTIGQFGSGIKYAPISAMRMGLEFIFTGFDSRGEYELRYGIEEEDGIKCIVYNYGDYVKQSSFTLEAGSMSWDTEWQIYREIVSNAKDNGNWKREIVNQIEHNPNEFAVYISASNHMMEVYHRHNQYFSDDRKVFWTCDYTNISFLKQIDDVERMYYKSVLVHTLAANDMSSMFDYELGGAALNEDRGLKDLISERIKITKAISRCSDPDLINQMLDKMFKETLTEFEAVSAGHWSYVYPNEEWAKCFYKKFGENAVILSGEQAIVSGLIPMLKAKGKKPVITGSKAVYTFLSGPCGIPNAENSIGDQLNYDIDNDINKYPALMEALKIATYFEPRISSMEKPLVTFNSKDEDTLLGVTINMSNPQEKQILISSKLADSGDIKSILATIIHEYDHYSSGVSDSMYREFRDLADNRIANLMYQMYKETAIIFHNDCLKIKTTDSHLYSTLDYIIQYLPSFGWHLLRIGKLTFKLEIDDVEINETGVCQVDETGSYFIINVQKNGKITRIS